MKVFKAKVDDVSCHEINAENFMEYAGSSSPYRSVDKNGSASFYAVCPFCDNPIQIIGLIERQTSDKRSPFGRHLPITVPSLAVYRQEYYDNCPAAVKNNVRCDKLVKKKFVDNATRKMLIFLRNKFDSICLTLQESIQIHISKTFAEKLLRKYLEDGRYLQAFSTSFNLPWMLAFLFEETIIGRVIYDEEMKCVLSSKVPEVVFHGNQLRVKEGCYLQLNISFINHKITSGTRSNAESITLAVVQIKNGKRKIVFKKEIECNYLMLQKYIDKAGNEEPKKDRFMDPEIINSYFAEKGLLPLE